MRGLPLLVLPLALLSCSAPPPSPAPVDECPITLTFEVQKGRGRHPLLVMSGTCPLPEGVVLKYSLSRLVDRMVEDRLTPQVAGAGGGTAEIEDQRFTIDINIDQPARYTVVVSIPFDLQEKGLVDEIRRKVVDGRTWRFTCDLRDQDWLFKAGKRLGGVAPLVGSVWELVAAFETATMSEERWTRESKELLAAAVNLRTSLEQSSEREFYPAAVGELYFMVRYLTGNAPYFYFKDGQFMGVDPTRGGRSSQPLGGPPARLDRDDASRWESFKRCLRESPEIAGREFCLYAIAARRAPGGALPEKVAEALEAAKGFPGVAPWAERLKSASPAGLDAIEAEIRSPQSPSRK